MFLSAVSAMTSGSEKRERFRHLTIRLTLVERLSIDTSAERAGMTSGSYVRRAVLGIEPPRQVRRPPVEKQELGRLLGQLGKVGSNLNQIARALHQTSPVEATEVRKALEGLIPVRAAILKALGREP
jgi:hypothetical protein